MEMPSLVLVIFAHNVCRASHDQQTGSTVLDYAGFGN